MSAEQQETAKMHRILNLLHVDHLDDGYLNTADAAEVTFQWVFNGQFDQGEVIVDKRHHTADNKNHARTDADDIPSPDTEVEDSVTAGAASDTDSYVYIKHTDVDSPNGDTRTERDAGEIRWDDNFKIFKFPPEAPPPAFGLGAWLAAGDNVFHITGKVGSGKSTLMKYICDHPQTAEHLMKWAGPGNKLVMAHFFFARDGNMHRRKLTGLRRALLASVLARVPDEIPHVFPGIWQRLGTMPYGAETLNHIVITDQDIQSAFDLLISRAGNNTATGHRVCFFIDALDQLEEDIHSGYSDLVELLRKWVDVSNGAVKMCVATREFPVFLQQLHPVKRVRLQDYTEADIKSFVYYSLSKDPYFRRLEIDRPKDVEDFTRSLSWSSEGVFLWIRYVVQAVRKALENRAPWPKIRQLLDQTPTEIEQHFKTLQSSIRREDRAEAYSVFALLRMEGRVGRIGTFSLLSYAFLADIIEESDLAKRYPIEATLDYSEIGVRLEDASIRLRGSCAGLVELRGDPYYSTRNIWPHVLDKLPLLSQHLTFTHRTVPEFLDEALNGEKDNPYLTDFNVVRLAVNLLVVRIKAIPFPDIAPVEILHDSESSYAAPSDLVNFIQGLVEEIEVLLLMIQRLEPSHQERCYPELAWVDEVLCARQGLTGGSLDVDWSQYSPVDKYGNGTHTQGRLPILSLLHISVAHGPAGYVCWAIDQRPELLEHLPNHLELYDTVVRNSFLQRNCLARYPGFKVVEELFDRCLLKAGQYPWTNFPCPQMNFSSIFVSAIWSILGFKPPGSVDTSTTYAEDSTAPEWEIIEILLRNGRADPLLYLQALPPPRAKEWSEYLVVYFQHEVAHIQDFKPQDAINVFDGSDGIPRWYTLITCHFTPWLSTRPDLRCSLKELLEFFQPHNLDSLLTLIDSLVKCEGE